MTVKELLEVLLENVAEADRPNANIEIWCGDQEYTIESMGGFRLSPDITFHIKPIESSILAPMTFKAEHMEMVRVKVKEALEGAGHDTP